MLTCSKPIMTTWKKTFAGGMRRSLVTPDQGGSCGIGWLPRWAPVKVVISHSVARSTYGQCQIYPALLLLIRSPINATVDMPHKIKGGKKMVVEMHVKNEEETAKAHEKARTDAEDRKLQREQKNRKEREKWRICLALEIGQDDLQIVSPSWFESERSRGIKLTGLIIDHAAQLTNRQLVNYRMALALVWPLMRVVRKLRKINKWNTLKSAATTLP